MVAVSNEYVVDLEVTVDQWSFTCRVQVVHSQRHFMSHSQLPRPVHLYQRTTVLAMMSLGFTATCHAAVHLVMRTRSQHRAQCVVGEAAGAQAASRTSVNTSHTRYASFSAVFNLRSP